MNTYCLSTIFKDNARLFGGWQKYVNTVPDLKKYTHDMGRKDQ